MSEAARKSYFFVPPSGQNAWSKTPPTQPGHYWVRAVDPNEAPTIVWFDPSQGHATPPAWSLTASGDAAPPIALDRIGSWWPAAVVPPTGGLPS